MENQQPLSLSLEQQFAIRSFFTQVDQMSLVQAQDMLKLLYKHHISYKAYTEGLLKHAWKLEQHELNTRPTTEES